MAIFLAVDARDEGSDDEQVAKQVRQETQSQMRDSLQSQSEAIAGIRRTLREQG